MRRHELHGLASFRVGPGVVAANATVLPETEEHLGPNTRPLERRPVHAGDILREDFLTEYGLSVLALADAAGVSRQSMNELLRERRAVSPEMALRLGKLFSTTKELWLNLQTNLDLWDAARALKREIAHIHLLRVA